MKDNLKEALEYLVDLGKHNAKPEVLEIHGKTYCTKNLNRHYEDEMAAPLTAYSLTALVDYIKNNKHELREKMIIHIVQPGLVKLISGLTKERSRECLFESRANESGFRFNYYYGQEEFIINMQSALEETEDLSLLLQVAGNVEGGVTANYGDDGTTQKTTIKKGVASKTDVIVPNPVTLRAYRTFLEVDQPESEFVFRIGEGMNGEPEFKLVNADGGMWEYDAVSSIKEYLQEELDGIENITIIG